MKINQTYILAGIVAALAIIAFVVLTMSPGKYDDFAKCVSERGAKMYGAYWCPHCKEQKAMFGNSWKYIDYVECSASDGSQLQLCKDAGILGYPTWEFKNGSRESGSLSLEELARATSCELPS